MATASGVATEGGLGGASALGPRVAVTSPLANMGAGATSTVVPALDAQPSLQLLSEARRTIRAVPFGSGGAW